MKSLTSYAKSGGCNCKVPENIVKKITKDIPRKARNDIVCGGDTADDAAVLHVTPRKLVVESLDYQNPVVDKPEQAGAIAMANALSDIFAMGGDPKAADIIMGYPFENEGHSIPKRIEEGMYQKCKEAGVEIVGGHTIESETPHFGASVHGEVFPENLKTNAGAQPGHKVILTKPIGTGVHIAAYKTGALSEKYFKDIVKSMMQLNIPGKWLSLYSSVSCMTDVTGFGLVGHSLEICNASKVDLEFNFNSIPCFSPLLTYHLCCEGHIPSLSWRNFEEYSEHAMFSNDIHPDKKILMFDGQTNGGLLFAVDPSDVDEILDRLLVAGFKNSAVIGTVKEQSKDTPQVRFI